MPSRFLFFLLVALVAAVVFVAALEGLLSLPTSPATLHRPPREDLQPEPTSSPLPHTPRNPAPHTATAEKQVCRKAVARNLSSLPIPGSLSKSVTQVLQQTWVKDLQAFLAKLPSCSSLVSVVCADSSYREVLLNWLISAILKPETPLSNILVIALDGKVHRLMVSRGFSSVLVRPASILEATSPGLRVQSVVFLTRLSVLRIINSLGYSVVHYDTDTIILRNPEALYRSHWGSDVVGSVGWWPYILSRKPPGFTLCMGVILFRSTPQTERLWDKISRLKLKSSYAQDDQIRINYALKLMAVKWSPTCNISALASTGRGQYGFQVTALPTSEVCRRDWTCKEEHRSTYYVWHGNAGKSGEKKILSATRSGLWFLRRDWEEFSGASQAKGLQWLQQIAQ